MSNWSGLIRQLELVDEDSIDDHVFELYSERQLQNNLGYFDRSKNTISITLPHSQIDLTITQSLTQLSNQSSNSSSTGFICWQSSIFFTDWLLSSSNCPIKLNPELTVLELGSGVAGIVPTILSSKSKHVIATDQKHILKLLKSNIEENTYASMTTTTKSRIDVIEFDWEDVDSGIIGVETPDVVIACDTIYNEYLIPYFINSLRNLLGDQSIAFVCVQLRDSITMEKFVTDVVNDEMLILYTVPSSLLNEELRNGYVVYCIVKKII
ncbi:RKM5 Ribosomal lysine N-methyltransferase 5 [Candida maltosa Xu316]